MKDQMENKPRRGRPKSDKVTVTIRLKRQTDEILDEACGNSGLTRSEFIDQAIRLKVRMNRFKQGDEPL